MRSEILQAWRAIQGRPGLAAILVLSLAVGIGANAMVFAIVDGAMLRPFTFPQPDRLVGVGAAYPRLRQPLDFFEALSGPEYKEIKDGARGVSSVAGFDLGNEPVMVNGTPERVFTAYVFDDLLATLSLPPARGRSFSREELSAGAPVAVISYSFWLEKLAASPTAVGSAIIVGGRPHEIIGVMPARTRIYGTDLWVPMAERPETLPRTRRQFNVLARLAPGGSLDELNASLDVVARRMDQQFRSSVAEYEGFGLAARRWADIDVWGGGQVTSVAFAGLGLLMLLVAANLTNLLLARAVSRRREMSLRVALGASPAQLRRQVLTEVLLQAGAGAVLGCLLAWIGTRTLSHWVPGFVPEDAAVAVNVRVLGFAFLLAMVSAALVGLVPALQLARARPLDALGADGGRVAGSRASRRLQSAVVALELALALVVASSAVILTVNTWRILRVDPGFDTDGLVMMRLTLPIPKYAGNASMAFFDRLVEATEALPSVEHASLSNQPPPGLFSRAQFAIDGRGTGNEASLPAAFYTTAGPSYDDTIGLRLVRGRWFDERADRSGPREVVINQAAAAGFFSGEDPLGQRIKLMGAVSDGAWAEIVGIVADVRNRGLSPSPSPEIIGSVRQIPDRRQSQLYLVVRARGATDTSVSDVRRVVSGLDAGQPIYAVTTVSQQYQNGVARRRSAARVLVVFGALACVIAGLGIYGVLSHAVGERTREIGVSLALGAPESRVRRLVARQAMVPVLAGIAGGVLALAIGSQIVSSWIFGVTPEPLAIAAVAVELTLVAAVASAVPAWRASRLDPVTALRHE